MIEITDSQLMTGVNALGTIVFILIGIQDVYANRQSYTTGSL